MKEKEIQNEVSVENIHKIIQLRLHIAENINKLSLENYYGDTPDYIMAEAAIQFLETQRLTLLRRDNHFNNKDHKYGTIQ